MPAKTPRRAAASAKKASPPPAELLTLRYSLAELPSAQHRAGLAGLVLLTHGDKAWMKRQKRKGAYEPVRVDEHGAEFQFDLTGLQSLMDEIYDATTEEQPQAQIRKDRNGKPVKPLREEEIEVPDKDGKVKRKKQYVYPVTVPKAAYLKDRDPSEKGVWVKLWRDMVWTTLRGVPKTRAPFEARAEGRETSDAEDAWEQLRSSSDAPTDLKSTYYLGAMESTADNVPFKDRARFQFLLHFWPYVAQVYVLQTIEVDERGHPRDKLTNEFVVAVPDVALLSSFCGDYHEMLKERSGEVALYRPRDAVIDLPGEGALDFSWRLRIAKREGRRRTADLVLGFDVFHVYKDGNNVRLASTARISPTVEQTDRFQTLRGEYKDPRFRRLQLANLLAERQPLHRLDAIFQTVPYEQTVGSHSFRHDARHYLKLTNTSESPMSEEPSDAAQSLEQLVYELISQYVHRKTEAKRGYNLKTALADERKKRDYNEEQFNIAKGAFLAVRSRTADKEFVSYFAGTLCSVPHHIGPEKFKVLARALQADPGKVRTLTLLALSANG